MAKNKITKAHIICNLLAVNGPMAKDELLRQTAIIEGKPYRPGSNGSYFHPVAQRGSPFYTRAHYDRQAKSSLVANGTIKVVAKQGNTFMYDLDTKGFLIAQEYKQLIGI